MAGISPRAASSAATYATIGVLPLPPVLRLPTLITGRSRRRRRDGLCAYHRRRHLAAVPYNMLAAERITSINAEPEGPASGLHPASMYQPERSHDSAGRWKQIGDDGERLVLGATIGFDQRPRGRTKLRAPHRIRSQAHHRLLQLALRPDLHRRVVADERVDDLLEVLHVRAEQDRLAKDGRLQDVVAAMVHETAADEHDRRHLIELRQLADRVEDDDVGARLRVDRQLRAARGDEARLAREALHFAKAFGLPRRENGQRRRRGPLQA